MKVFVLMILLQGSSGTETLTLVDNISSLEQCQHLGQQMEAAHNVDGTATLRWRCFDVVKAR
jgi:hypothetical protein